MRAQLQRLVHSPAFTELLDATRTGARRTEQRAPGDAAQIYRLLMGLQSLATGKTRPTAAERVARKHSMTASGCAPRQSQGETGHGSAQHRAV